MNKHITTKFRILVCSSDVEARQVFQSTLTSLVTYDIELETFEEFLGHTKVDQEAYDLIVVDLADGDLLGDEAIVTAKKRFGNLPFIFMSNELTGEQMRHLVRLEGNDWLVKPLQSRAVIDAVKHVDMQKGVGGIGHNMVHAVVSCGGGAGGTSVAISLAHWFSRPRKRATPSVALFDLDFSSAAVGAYLNIQNKYDFDRVIAVPERVDLEFLDVVTRKHENGFSVFSFESTAIHTSEKGAELVLRILDVIAFQNNHTVLDIPAGESVWKNQILAGVDTISIVTGPTIPALKRAKRILNDLGERFGRDKIASVIVNRSRKSWLRGFTGKKETERIFAGVDVTFLPDETAIMTDALNQGELPIDVDAKSHFYTHLKGLSEKLRVIEGVRK